MCFNGPARELSDSEFKNKVARAGRKDVIVENALTSSPHALGPPLCCREGGEALAVRAFNGLYFS